MHHSLYHFDVLPLHPPPMKLESLTSYLMRIAEANHIHTFAALSAITDFTRIQYATDVRAYSRLVLSNIAGRTVCQYEQIMATTLGHLEQKFGRSERPGLPAGFFRNCLSTCLRYCPACIAQKAYYSLAWRFLALPGCTEL